MVQTGTDASGNPIFSQQSSYGATGNMYAGGLSGLGSQYFNTAGQGAPDSSAALDKAEAFATSRLDRQRDLSTKALDTKLKNQGLQPGTPAYDNAMRSTLDSYGDQRNTMTAQLQNQMFNQGLQGRQQQMSELQPGLGFASTALAGPSQQYGNLNVPNIDLSSIYNQAWQQQQQNVQQQNQYNNAMMGGLAGLGGGILGGPLMSPLLGGMGTSMANYFGFGGGGNDVGYGRR